MDNRCVCCGEIIPEGRQVCPNCEHHIADVRKKDELKPCPFCGGSVYMIYSSFDKAFKFYHKSSFDVAECPISEPLMIENAVSLADAAEQWNRRADDGNEADN